MRKLQGWIALLFTLITIALWLSVAFNYNDRQEKILSNWNDAQMILVKNAASAVQGWMELRLQTGANVAQVEQEVFKRFIAPIHLLQNGDAWIYNRDHVIFDESSDFPDVYRGKSIDMIFDIQKANGASHYSEVVQGVLNATEGTGWYIWLPEKGREYVAWTSVKLPNGYLDDRIINPRTGNSFSLFLQVAITDTGKNISNKELPDLFLPFQEPGTEGELTGNLGLDLAICRQLVERAGGGIWVETRGDSTKGLVVHFSFKLATV